MFEEARKRERERERERVEEKQRDYGMQNAMLDFAAMRSAMDRMTIDAMKQMSVGRVLGFIGSV